MKARKITALLLAVLLAIGIAGCGGKTTEKESGPITVTDMTGREISLEGPADKIVALTPPTARSCTPSAGRHACRTRRILRLPRRGRRRARRRVRQRNEHRQIIALGPDVVLMSTMAQTTEHIESLEAAGIKVVASESADIDGVFEAIGLIGHDHGQGRRGGRRHRLHAQTPSTVERKGPRGGGGRSTSSLPARVRPVAAGSGTFMEELASISRP